MSTSAAIRDLKPASSRVGTERLSMVDDPVRVLDPLIGPVRESDRGSHPIMRQNPSFCRSGKPMPVLFALPSGGVRDETL